MKGSFRPTAWTLVVVMIGQPLLAPSAQAKDLIQMMFHMKRPPAVKDPSVEDLAEQIDWLEKHVDSYGSVVAKQPDVWGQARLTKHRQEYECQMYQQLNQFDLYLQGAVSQSDQSFLMNALTLQAAASTPSPSTSRGNSVNVNMPPTTNTTNATSQSAPATSPSTGTPTGGGNATPSGTAAPSPVTTSTATPIDSGSNFFVGVTPPSLQNFGLAGTNPNAIGIEPTIALDQRSAYLDHLHALRRRNEGDDTADSPGYGLYLMRIPVSIMPGKRTYHGYAGEITLTATPHLSPALLPITFRNLVVNDVVDQLALPITRIADYLERCLPNESIACPGVAGTRSRIQPNRAARMPMTEVAKYVSHSHMRSLHTPGTRLRQARSPIAPTQIPAVFGPDELLYIANEFTESYQGPNVRWNDGPNKHVMYLDVQRFLQSEVEAAYDLLARPGAEPLWINSVNLTALAAEIQAGDFDHVCQRRDSFYDDIGHPTGASLWQGEDAGRPCDEQVVKSLAWAIIVESALLNQQLVLDMREVAEAKGCASAAPDGMPFYLPHPDPAACAAFNEYVSCRWPIHVFALDPDIQEQNIANDFQRRRELQIALSLGFAQGEISANDMLNYARRVETEIQTVDLNETAVGFSYGNDTFGWRFYPRLQAPPIKGNLEAFGDTLFGPSTRCDNLERKIEPGMRECVALVIMPSFVPFITLETRSNWFRLNAHSGWLPTHHKREMSMVDTMKLSRSIRSMHEMAAHLCDSPAYRPGDVRLMMTRVHQLDRQLPMQQMMVQVPIENTLGGYQMFNNGVTDLAPELHGWYGAPGILISATQPPAACQGCSSCTSQTPAANPGSAAQPATGGGANAPAGGAGQGGGNAQGNANPAGGAAAPAAGTGNSASPPATPNQTANAPAQSSNLMQMMPDCTCSGTTVFLVGNHFSTHDTRVIAGGVCVPRAAMTLLSRQVLQVTIPWNANIVTLDGDTWVDVHVATPYGVTGYLHIPVYSAASPSATTLAQIQTAVSPLEVQLDPVNQQVAVNFKHDPDITITGLAISNAPTITMKCVDQNVCQVNPQEKNYSAVIAVVSDTSQSYGSVNLTDDGTKDWPLSLDTAKTWKAIQQEIFPAAPGKVYQSLEAQYQANPNNVSLNIDFYLQGAGVPTLHVVGPLPLKFQEAKGTGAAPGNSGTMIHSVPARSQARAATMPPGEIEDRYAPQQRPVQSQIRLMPPTTGQRRAARSAPTDSTLERLPPVDQIGRMPPREPVPQASAARRGPQSPYNPSAEARALWEARRAQPYPGATRR